MLQIDKAKKAEKIGNSKIKLKNLKNTHRSEIKLKNLKIFASSEIKIKNLNNLKNICSSEIKLKNIKKFRENRPVAGLPAPHSCTETRFSRTEPRLNQTRDRELPRFKKGRRTEPNPTEPRISVRFG